MPSPLSWPALACALLAGSWAEAAGNPTSPILDKQLLLTAQSFWDNRDWAWYARSIPFFECPDPLLNTTYYYRWELVTKHLTYGSPASGYVFTEFIDRPFWSGTYGAISCPAGHQLYEVRWLRDPRFARDYARYWLETPGAQPRRYSCWLADAVWAVHQVHPNDPFTKSLLRGLVRNYEAWERSHFEPAAGLFWQTGHDDGMEININSRQSQDTVRGAPGYRPTLNSYMWADALAIAEMADLAGDPATARAFRSRAASLKQNLQQKLWDPKRQFFLPMARHDEHRDGFVVKAGSLTYQTGRFAGSDRGREEIGFVPWQFGLPDPGHERAWATLMDREAFFADFGPTTVERHDPQFLISPTCCVWSGQSWPYATTQTLKGLANLLQTTKQDVITRSEYLKLLQVYSRTHRKSDRPYIAEAANPDTGSWQGHDSYNHSEHYFHSGYVDLIITGLVGLRPRADDVVELHPLAPAEWPYFAIDDVPYHGHRLAVVWDREGTRYAFGRGLHIVVDGKRAASSETLGRLTARLPGPAPAEPGPPPVNLAVNNDGLYYPKATASFAAPDTPVSKAVDGNYWYHASPPNRWTCAGSPHERDWCAVDFGIARKVDEVKLYVLDDGGSITAPQSIDLEFWTGSAWAPVPAQRRTPAEPTGHRANVIAFPEIETTRLRALLTHRPGSQSGLSEFEAWGTADQPLDAAPPPPGNLAFNPGDRSFPKASASFTSSYDRVVLANDGRTSYTPSPANRWTSFGSPNSSDWLQIDFGEPRNVARVELAIYDDHGGVRAPSSYQVEWWDGHAWQPVARPQFSLSRPVGGQLNEVQFQPVKTPKIRVVFTHAGTARSGVSEIYAWSD